MKDGLPSWVASLRATIRTKLLVAFLLVIAVLLGAVGIGFRSLVEMHQRSQESVQSQRKIAAYRQLSHDAVTQLHGVASALLQPDEARLGATLRQLEQFGYDLDRLQYLTQEETEITARIQRDYDAFFKTVTRMVALIRAGRGEEGKRLRIDVVWPLADRFERQVNQLVNKADADMVASIEEAEQAYAQSRLIVAICAGMSTLLALGLGYVISRSIIDPIKEMERRLGEIAGARFDTRVRVSNRDELGALAEGLNRMTDDLGHLYAQLDAERETASQASQDKSHFLAAASHDLRQPMHALSLWVANLQVALRGRDPHEVRRAASAIESACKSLGVSFNSILDMSRFDAGTVKLNPTQVNLTSLAQRIVEEFAPSADQKGLVLRLHAERGAQIHGLTDEVVLGRALRNLVGNALKFSRTGGVLVGVRSWAGRARIDVVDTGVGVPRQHWEDIFKEFFQLSNSGRDRQQGVGLGLYIVRKSVDMLDGHALTFYSREGHGSKFSITLPSATGVASTLAGQDTHPRFNRLVGAYVVVVEDEPLVLQGMVFLLRGWGCLVVAEELGRDALERARENERLPDLLLTDLRLSQGESGWDVVTDFRGEFGDSLPVLVMTGNPVHEIVTHAERMRVHVLSKPVDATTMRETLVSLLPERHLV